MLDTITFESVVEGLDSKDQMCEDVAARHEARKADWYTLHEGCGYFVCDECKVKDVREIERTIANGWILSCAQCRVDGVPPHSVKFIRL